MAAPTFMRIGWDTLHNSKKYKHVIIHGLLLRLDRYFYMNIMVTFVVALCIILKLIGGRIKWNYMRKLRI